MKIDIDKQQREYFLNQQLKTIQEELGGSSQDQEISDLREKGTQKKWSKEVAAVFEKELERLNRINPAAAEYSVTLNYLELLLELPWNEFTSDNFDLKRAQKVLNADHYGLDKVKNRKQLNYVFNNWGFKYIINQLHRNKSEEGLENLETLKGYLNTKYVL